MVGDGPRVQNPVDKGEDIVAKGVLEASGCPEMAQKKSRRFRRLEGDNREASNRVDRSHSRPKLDIPVMNEKA
jgi:hypothetical protein